MRSDLSIAQEDDFDFTGVLGSLKSIWYLVAKDIFIQVIIWYHNFLTFLWYWLSISLLRRLSLSWVLHQSDHATSLEVCEIINVKHIVFMQSQRLHTIR